MALPATKIDLLPEPFRGQIIKRLLSREGASSIARDIGVSAQTVCDYRKRRIPVLLGLTSQDAEKKGNSVLPIAAATALVAEANEVARSIPLRNRVERTWNRIERGLDIAEKAKDLMALWPGINQAHKNIQLLGQLTGELTDAAAAANISIRIVVPDGAQAEAIAAQTVAAKHSRALNLARGPIIDIEPMDFEAKS